MKVTRRHLIKMLSYAVPALSSRRMPAFVSGKTGVASAELRQPLKCRQARMRLHRPICWFTVAPLPA